MSLNINISVKKAILILAAIYLGAGIAITSFESRKDSIGFQCIDGSSLRNLGHKEKIRRAIMVTAFWLPMTISGNEGFAFGSHCV